jgi:DedD protein
MPQSTPASDDTVQQARTQARQRLIGAVVLLLVGIIGFPLVFETQPRPIPVDVAIEIPRKDATPTVQAPAPRAAPGAGAASAAPIPSSATRREEASPSESAAPAAPRPAPAVAPAAPVTPVAVAPAPATAQAAAPQAAPATPKAAAAAPKPADSPAAAAAVVESGRFVVQVGAFADAAAVQAIRNRAEKLGLKTYTQVTQTVAGNRIRVRIGPFMAREAADQAAAKAKAGGLSAVVLTL